MSVEPIVFMPSPPQGPVGQSWQQSLTMLPIESMNSIEQGYFVFTMMPSLRCSLNCPHCYLSLEQRRSSEIMSIPSLDVVFGRVSDYFRSELAEQPKIIVFYWYGGEPTEMGLSWFNQAFALVEKHFPREEGFHVRHDILTSLVTVDEPWFDVFKVHGQGRFQTSFDGLMRGSGYVKRWEAKVRQAVGYGLEPSTISVVNQRLAEQGPENVLDYLADLGVKEASFLPFMLNEQNEKDKYAKFSGSMLEYSDFMIRLSSHWLAKKCSGDDVPMIGQLMYILSRETLAPEANVAGQTLFLMPNGDFVLPDYKEGWKEYMRPFGNIFESTFREILQSRERGSYLRKQYLGNMNPECLSCERKNACVMEFWKDNKPDDECFGAKKYVDWVLGNPALREALGDARVMAS